MIEAKKPPGIMCILDDVCFTMHAGSDGADETFVQKMDASIGGHDHYIGGSDQFVINHYAGSVTYQSEGFTESNKDALFKDLIQLMQTSTKYCIINAANLFVIYFPNHLTNPTRNGPLLFHLR